MQAIFSGKLSIVVVVIFFVLIIAAFIMQRLVISVRKNIYLTQYELERGPIIKVPEPPKPEDLVPGYTLMTKDDYREILQKVTKEVQSESNNTVLEKEKLK